MDMYQNFQEDYPDYQFERTPRADAEQEYVFRESNLHHGQSSSHFYDHDYDFDHSNFEDERKYDPNFNPEAGYGNGHGLTHRNSGKYHEIDHDKYKDTRPRDNKSKYHEHWYGISGERYSVDDEFRGMEYRGNEMDKYGHQSYGFDQDEFDSEINQNDFSSEIPYRNNKNGPSPRNPRPVGMYYASEAEDFSGGVNKQSFNKEEELYEPIEDLTPDYGGGNSGKYNLIQDSNLHHIQAGNRNVGYESDDNDPQTYVNESSENHNVQIRRPKRQNEKIILDDGSKTYVFRKRGFALNESRRRVVSGRSISRHSGVSRQSTVKLKSGIVEGFVPSHRDNVLTLKDKMKMLHQQETTHGVVNVYREKILQDSELHLKGFAAWRYKQNKRWINFKEQVDNVLSIFKLWAGSFKTIEGRFGTAVMNYFTFIRWLMFMNLYMTAIMIGVTFVPQLVLPNTGLNKTSATVQECTEQYDNYVNNLTSQEDVANQILDVIQGTGWMEQTVLFYGIYQNKTITDHKTNYNMSLAYLLATGACFLVSFFLIVRNTGKGLKEGVMNRDSTINQYFNKVFCGGWDYCISEQKAADRRHHNFLQELQADLETQRILWKKQSRTTRDKVKLYSIRTILNILVCAALAGSLYLIYYTNDTMLRLQENNFTELHAVVQALIQYLPSITITLLNIIVPELFKKLVSWEDYTPAFEIRSTLLRIILLRLASLGILIGSLYTVITTNDSTTSRCGNSRWEVTSNGDQFSTSIKCWETYVGQQIYKLIIMDFLVVVISTFLVEFPRRIIHQRFHKTNKLISMVGLQEFDLPKVVLDIVYSQTLCWMGMFFCPLTPLIGFVKCFIFFYVRKVSLLKNCEQPVRPYRTSRSNSLFAAILFLSFLLSAIPLTYLIGSFQPSQSCGPFRQYSGEHFVFFGTINDLIRTWPTLAVNIFSVIGSTAFLVPAILIVCSVMYGFWAAKESSKRQAEILQEELTEEGRDKQFLVAQVNEILQQLEATSS